MAAPTTSAAAPPTAAPTMAPLGHPHRRPPATVAAVPQRRPAHRPRRAHHPRAVAPPPRGRTAGPVPPSSAPVGAPTTASTQRHPGGGTRTRPSRSTRPAAPPAPASGRRLPHRSDGPKAGTMPMTTTVCTPDASAGAASWYSGPPGRRAAQRTPCSCPGDGPGPTPSAPCTASAAARPAARTRGATTSRPPAAPPPGQSSRSGGTVPRSAHRAFQPRGWRGRTTQRAASPTSGTPASWLTTTLGGPPRGHPWATAPPQCRPARGRPAPGCPAPVALDP